MAQIGDTLSDDEVRSLVSKYGREKAAAFMTLDENAPDSQFQDIHNYGYSIPGVSTERAHPGMTEDQLAGGAGKLGASAGVLAPLVEGATTGTFLPAAGGLGIGLGTGLATDYALKKTGLTPLLERKAAELRAGMPEPQHAGGSGAVALNFLDRLLNETTPRGMAANALEAAPTLASSATGALAGLGGTKLSGLLSEGLLGKPKVPTGQEAGALLAAMGKEHPVVAAPGEEGGLTTLLQPKAPNPRTTGELREAMQAGRDIRGKRVGAAKEAAYAATELPADFERGIGTAVMEGLTGQGNAKGMMGEFDPQFSKSPKASADVIQTIKEAAGKLDSLDKLRAIQSQFDAKAAQARQAVNAMNPSKAVSPEADVYSSVSKSLDKYIKGLLPAGPRASLEAANRPFSGYGDLQQIALRSSAGGKLSPAKFKALWDTKTPAQQAKMDPNGTIRAMLDQGGANIGPRLWEAIKQLPNVGRALKPLTKQGKLPVRFNKPPVELPAQAVGAASGLSPLLVNQQNP